MHVGQGLGLNKHFAMDASSVETSVSFIENTFAGLGIATQITDDCHDDDCQLQAPVMCHEDRLAVEMLMMSLESSDCDTAKCDSEHEIAQSSKGKQIETVALNVVEAHVETEKPSWKPKFRKKKKKSTRKKHKKAKGRQNGKSGNDCEGKRSKQASENSTNRGIPGNHARGATYRQEGRARECQGNDSDSDDEGRRRDSKLPKGHYAGIPWETDEHMSVDKSTHSQSQNKASATAVLVAQEEHVAEICELLDPEEVGFQRIWNFRSQGFDERQSQLATMVANRVTHCSHPTNCDNCIQPEYCNLVRRWISHYKACPLKDIKCSGCKYLICGVTKHAHQCDNKECEVPNCHFYRKQMLDRNQRKKIPGTVVHSTTMIFKVGQIVNEDVDYTYLHKQKLGQGSHGDVHRVWFYHLQKEVEADIVAKEVKYDPSDEAKIHQLIRHDHPNLLGAIMVVRFPGLCDVGNDKKINGYILMERGERTLYDLKRHYKEQHECGLPIRDAVYYLRQTLDGLRFLHDNKIVHKDIKDMNIMLFEENERAKISDWDGALFIVDEMSAANLDPVGTPGFCAPEVMEKKCHGYPADIFSTAVMFLEMLYEGQYKKRTELSYEPVLERRRAALERLQHEYPELGRLIKKCLADDPADRPTAFQLVHNPLLAYENNYKVNLPLRSNSGGNDVEPADFTHYADLRGPVGDRMRTHVARLSSMTDSQISASMDNLPKLLPSENVPQSNDWVGTATVEEASEQSEPVESMDTL